MCHGSVLEKQSELGLKQYADKCLSSAVTDLDAIARIVDTRQCWNSCCRMEVKSHDGKVLMKSSLNFRPN